MYGTCGGDANVTGGIGHALGIREFITVRFATETGSYITPVTRLYGTKINLEDMCLQERTAPSQDGLRTPEQNKAYRDGFGYATPSKTKVIIVDSDGDINKIVDEMK